MSHTPGPWKVHDEGHSYPWEIFPMEGGTLIARVSKEANTDITPEIAAANAHLIAAAPDLLEALKSILRSAEDIQGASFIAMEASDAIAKAEGK